MKKYFFVLAVGAVLLTGCSAPKVTGLAASQAPASAASQAPATVAVPNVVGMQGDAARATLEAAGLAVDWSEIVVIAGNWSVDAQVPAAGSNSVVGAKILLTVSKPTATAEAPAVAAPAAPAVSAEFKSALSKAKSYSDTMHMSKSGLYDQLTSQYGEQFSPEAAQYAVDNVQADWNANALAMAKQYQETMSMSPEAIRDQLTSDYGEKFTAGEADYAIQHLND